MSDLTKDLLLSSLMLATDAGGRDLHAQIAAAINSSVNFIADSPDMPKFTDDQRRLLVNTLATAFMERCFNPAYSEAEHRNGLGLGKPIEQNGYNITEPLCFLPLQKVVNTIRKGN